MPATETNTLTLGADSAMPSSAVDSATHDAHPLVQAAFGVHH